jgi:photosystem II stability/assembly factor-like uncharacterized protein
MHSRRVLQAAMLAIARAGDRLVAVGERGFVLLSDDDGKSWRQAKSVPVSVSLTEVQFIDAKEGWAVGHLGVVLHTTDGGETWTKQFDGNQAAALALKSAQAYAKLPTTPKDKAKAALDAAKLLVSDGPDKPFLDLYFLNAKTGFIVGAYNLIFRTDDGGKSWQPLLTRTDNPQGFHLYGIGKSGDTYFIAGEQGTLLKSTDGGNSFHAIKSPYDGSFFGLTVTHDGAILIYGMAGHAYRSDDLGETWTQVMTGTAAGLSAAYEAPDHTLYLAAQSGEVAVSHDDGRTFKRLPLKRQRALAGITVAPDKALIAATLHGVDRLGLKENTVSLR